jgi:hypothetical protein
MVIGKLLSKDAEVYLAAKQQEIFQKLTALQESIGKVEGSLVLDETRLSGNPHDGPGSGKTAPDLVYWLSDLSMAFAHLTVGRLRRPLLQEGC